jgi:hypothetical protein
MRDICLRAGLGEAEITLTEYAVYTQDDDGSFIESDAYEKLFNHFCDEGDMPLEVAKAISLEPDIWILDRLTDACNLLPPVV